MVVDIEVDKLSNIVVDLEVDKMAYMEVDNGHKNCWFNGFRTSDAYVGMLLTEW